MIWERSLFNLHVTPANEGNAQTGKERPGLLGGLSAPLVGDAIDLEAEWPVRVLIQIDFDLREERDCFGMHAQADDARHGRWRCRGLRRRRQREPGKAPQPREDKRGEDLQKVESHGAG